MIIYDIYDSCTIVYNLHCLNIVQVPKFPGFLMSFEAHSHLGRHDGGGRSPGGGGPALGAEVLRGGGDDASDCLGSAGCIDIYIILEISAYHDTNCRVA